MTKIDSDWFYAKLREIGATGGELARFLSVDPSSVSRMLKGERKMSAEEQDKVSAFLRVPLEIVALHRRGEETDFGFAEKKQETYAATSGPPALDPTVKWFTEDDIIYKDGKRWMETQDGRIVELHPAFGCMKGTITIPDDLDLTAPVDPDWGKVYEDD
ncbi:XRE family transcriptional regulator [Rhizobiales bacterium RZME27]|uniref:XRE family transcriptional regulator n=1 Tax=Endobacterium cereale TaxID=2663029 RepID=A0A6A8A774_9HYPH|nr:helix-turn-helix transcriptional regulator [Endobacterium cereale]MEB2843191.1 helix-turn-helix transcriptional regulator [Endobacterium cereale]MQY47152.1 XRE family transcriptional regulator [Endobacterium cereale]